MVQQVPDVTAGARGLRVVRGHRLEEAAAAATAVAAPPTKSQVEQGRFYRRWRQEVLDPPRLQQAGHRLGRGHRAPPFLGVVLLLLAGAAVTPAFRVRFLVRAVVIDGKERGMTAFARLVAEALGIRLGPSVAGDFHVPSGVADATRDTRLRLVLV